MDNDHEIELNVQSGIDNNLNNHYSKWKWFFCYTVAFWLVIAIIYGFSGIVAEIVTNALSKEVTRIHIISIVAVGYFLFQLTRNLGNHWRASEKNEIGTAVTNFPNPFYDPNFKPGPLAIQKQYQDLFSEYRRKNMLLNNSKKYTTELEGYLNVFESKLRVLLRYNENTNRLIRSLNFLFLHKDAAFIQTMLRNILAECITVLEKDQSDKSISLFQVQEDRLRIIESVRINAESIAKRSFKKGRGFAGYIWHTQKPEIVNEIEPDDERFKDFQVQASPIGSILGIPLIVDEQILGVLCLQSEAANGFNHADLRTVEFYSRMCTMILLYDKIMINQSKEG